jgi:hypothetical protein
MFISDPRNPKIKPNREWEKSLAERNIRIPFSLKYFSSPSWEVRAEVKSPPWTAKQEIPPEVSPVAKASHKFAILDIKHIRYLY